MNKFLATIVFMVTCVSLYAQSDTIQIKEVEITSTIKIDTTLPFAISTIDSKDINYTYNGQEVPLFFNQSPSVTVTSDAGNDLGYVYMRIRGVDQTRINFTLNGVPLNEPEDQGDYFSNYPDFLRSISNIQVQRGVGTSTYGSPSYIGSVNFDGPVMTTDGYTNIGYSYGSYNTQELFIEYKSKYKKNKSFYIRGSKVYTDGYRKHSGHNGQSVFLAGMFAKGKNVFKLNAFYGGSKNFQSWLGSTLEEIDTNRRVNGNSVEKDNFSQFHTQLQYSYSLNSKTTITSNLYYNYLDGDYDFDLDNFLGISNYNLGFYNYYMYSNFIGLLTNVKTDIKKVSLIVGFHQNFYNRTHIGSEINMGKLYENTGYKNETDLYAKVKINLNKFTPFIDIQYRHVTFDYDGYNTSGLPIKFNTINWDFINPKIGISYKPIGYIDLYYSIGYTGREPTRTDMFGGEDNLIDQNDILFTNPEYALDNELGMRFNRKNLYFNVNLYYMKFIDEIVLNGLIGKNGLPLRSNVDNSYRAGVETELSYSYKSFNIYFNYTYSKNKIIQGDSTITPILTPNNIFYTDINYKISIVTIGVNAKAQSKSYIDFTNRYQLNSFFLLNFYTQVNIKNKFYVKLWLNNILNETYYTNGMMHTYDGENYFPLYHVQAPFNFKISLTIKI